MTHRSLACALTALLCGIACGITFAQALTHDTAAHVYEARRVIAESRP